MGIDDVDDDAVEYEVEAPIAWLSDSRKAAMEGETARRLAELGYGS